MRLCNTFHVDMATLHVSFSLTIYTHTVVRGSLLTNSSNVVESSYRCVLFLRPAPNH